MAHLRAHVDLRVLAHIPLGAPSRDARGHYPAQARAAPAEADREPEFAKPERDRPSRYQQKEICVREPRAAFRACG